MDDGGGFAGVFLGEAQAVEAFVGGFGADVGHEPGVTGFGVCGGVSGGEGIFL